MCSLVPESSVELTADTTDRRWTVMVFMGTTTTDGDASLLHAAEADIAEMRAIGSGDGLNIFVQIHGNGVPRRAHISQHTPTMVEVPVDQCDPAGGNAIASFIHWSLMAAAHDARNPNHHSMLVLWGHASQFVIGRSPSEGRDIGWLDFAGLPHALDRSREDLPRLDILGFDAGAFATVEMAHEFGHFASYLLASQSPTPIPNWPYDQILERVRYPFGPMMDPAELGSHIVRSVCEAYASSRPVSLSLIDLKRVPELTVHIEMLARTLALAASSFPDSVVDVFQRSQTITGTPYIDVTDLCLTLMRESADPMVIESARALGDFLVSPLPPLIRSSDEGAGRPFVVEHGRNSIELARLNGISVYVPHVEPSWDFASMRSLYQSFQFAQASIWSDLVHVLALEDAPVIPSGAQSAPTSVEKRRDSVFVCYSHYDSSLVEQLLEHLQSLRDSGVAKVFSDRNIESGSLWQEKIVEELESATIAVVLVSPKFVNSAFIREVELPRLLQRAWEARPGGGLRIYYLVVNAVAESLLKELGLFQFQAAYDPKKPLARLRRPDRDVVYARLTESITQQVQRTR